MEVKHLVYILAGILWMLWTYFSIKEIKRTRLFQHDHSLPTVAWEMVHIVCTILLAICLATIKIFEFISEHWNTTIF